MEKIKIFTRKFRKSLAILAIVAISITSFSFADSYFEISKNLDIMTTMYRELNTYYVDEIDPAKLMRTGMEAMLNSLDPYTNYISESEVEDYRFMTTGQYGGIGATIFSKNDLIVIRDPYEGFAAQKSGLRSGDIILEVDGKALKGKTSADVSKILKGQPGTPVKLLIKRPGEEKEFEITLNREEIQINNVPYYGMINSSTGYIQLRGFTQDAGKELKDALIELKKNPELKSVVLDLRSNPGGLLHEAVNISNIFIDKGQLVVTTRGKVTEWDKTYKTLNTPVDIELPLVVLTNSNSASASEIVSGVIQDLDRGIVVGQRTFGKGLVQTTRPLTYNSQLKVTTAKYYIPSGRCIQAMDYSHRNDDGSVGKIPDSLIREFKTKNGRKVYDGGGVAPDITVEPDPLSNIAASLASKNLIFDYATIYRNNHPSIPSPKEFRLSDAEYADFVKFISDKEYDYTTKSEKLLDDYKAAATKEKYFTAIEKDFEMLKTKMIHDKQADLEKFKEEIKELLREEIVSRYYYQKGRIEASFEHDPEILKSLEVLNNRKLYDATLKGRN